MNQNAFLPDLFFDLSTYEHSQLFHREKFVWEALNQIETYLKTLSLGSIQSKIPDGVYLSHPEKITIGANCTIEPGVFIQGPCFIGNDCAIRQGAYIRGNVITGHHCVIGHDTEIKQSILLDHSHAAHFAYVGDSILGNHVNLGAGVKLANLKLTRGCVNIPFQQGSVSTGLRKFGAVIGDGAQLGCNSVTSPGCLIGKNSVVYPCINVRGVVPENYAVKSKSEIVMHPLRKTGAS